MAKPTLSRWLWRGSRLFRATSLPILLSVGCGPVNVVHADDLVTSNSLPQFAATAALEYQETDFAINNCDVRIMPRSAPFKKEPAVVPGRIVRGVLNFGANSSNAIPFLWQRGAAKLFLDLNRNQDLTDDPAGVFSTRGRADNYQTFANVHLLLHTSSGECPVLGDLNFRDYGARPGCNLEIRSFWQGKLTLAGQDWQVGLVPDILNQPVSFEAGQLLLRTWAERDKAFKAYGGSLDAFPFSRKLFLDGHAYQVACQTGSQNRELKPTLQFREQAASLGELKITGKYIRRLVLPGDAYLVLLDRPAATVNIPTGSYQPPKVLLEQSGVEASFNPGQEQSGRRISVDARTPAVLAVGGPLTNSVTVSRHGRDLRLDYQLLGAGGAAYQLVNRDYSRPPEFAVFKGGNKIASGAFEFG